MFGFTKKEIRHALMALGAGAGVFLAEAARITPDPWIDAGCYSGLAVLTAMGVGIARRSPGA